MEVCGQLQAQAVLRPGKSSRHPLGMRLGVYQSRSGRADEDAKSLPCGLSRIKPSLVLKLNEIYILLCANFLYEGSSGRYTV
jgi:hypothetical protein